MARPRIDAAQTQAQQAAALGVSPRTLVRWQKGSDGGGLLADLRAQKLAAEVAILEARAEREQHTDQRLDAFVLGLRTAREVLSASPGWISLLRSRLSAIGLSGGEIDEEVFRLRAYGDNDEEQQ